MDRGNKEIKVIDCSLSKDMVDHIEAVRRAMLRIDGISGIPKEYFGKHNEPKLPQKRCFRCEQWG